MVRMNDDDDDDFSHSFVVRRSSSSSSSLCVRLADERSGKGVMVYSDGAKYEGEWLGGKRHGQASAAERRGLAPKIA